MIAAICCALPLAAAATILAVRQWPAVERSLLIDEARHLVGLAARQPAVRPEDHPKSYRVEIVDAFTCPNCQGSGEFGWRRTCELCEGQGFCDVRQEAHG